MHKNLIVCTNYLQYESSGDWYAATLDMICDNWQNNAGTYWELIQMLAMGGEL